MRYNWTNVSTMSFNHVSMIFTALFEEVIRRTSTLACTLKRIVAVNQNFSFRKQTASYKLGGIIRLI